MSRLIDAETLLKVIKKHKKNSKSILSDGIVKEAYELALEQIEEVIEIMPTFDATEFGEKCYMKGIEEWVENVAAKLKEKAEECREKGFNHERKSASHFADIQYAKYMAYMDAINEVRKGGIDG